MAKSYSFLTAQKIIFGKDSSAALPAEIARLIKHELALSGRKTSAAQIKNTYLLIITGKSGLERFPQLKDLLTNLPYPQLYLAIGHEPDIATITALRKQAWAAIAAHKKENLRPITRRVAPQNRLSAAQPLSLIVGIGGGSVLDTAKALAALIPNKRSIMDYLEVIGKGMPLDTPPLPVIAIPTTAGTGSEVTKNAVLAANTERVKVSLRHDSMLPRLALLDPALTYTLPFNLTVQTGLDALVQVIEPFLSPLGTPLTNMFTCEGIMRGNYALAKIMRNVERCHATESTRDFYTDKPSSTDDISSLSVAAGSLADCTTDPYSVINEEIREELLFTSLLGGMALANSKLGAVHALAGVIGGFFTAPHGALCGRLLPPVLRANYKALTSAMKSAGNPPPMEILTTKRKFNALAELVINSADEFILKDYLERPDPADHYESNPISQVERMIQWLEKLINTLDVPRLAHWGLKKSDFPAIAAQAAQASSMKGNPLPLPTRTLVEILRAAY